MSWQALSLWHSEGKKQAPSLTMSAQLGSRGLWRALAASVQSM